MAKEPRSLKLAHIFTLVSFITNNFARAAMRATQHLAKDVQMLGDSGNIQRRPGPRPSRSTVFLCLCGYAPEINFRSSFIAMVPLVPYNTTEY